jgi:benzoyl-CoA reductase/2-hydroxyglutaryl-CoA dehydratase subunit BcrC/BadD/HgdB
LFNDPLLLGCETWQGSDDPLTAISDRYCERIGCPAKGGLKKARMDRIVELAKKFYCDGAIIMQEKLCPSHEADVPFVQEALEQAGILECLLEFDVHKPNGSILYPCGGIP